MRQELRQQILLYLNGHCTLRYLESWVLSNLQRILDSGDEEAIEMANLIDADLVELGEGLVDEKTLLEHLESLLSRYETIPLASSQTESRDIMESSTAVQTFRTQVKVLVPVEDLRLRHVFA